MDKTAPNDTLTKNSSSSETSLSKKRAACKG